MDVNQQTVEEFKATAAHVEERIERLRDVLEREELRRLELDLAEIRGHINQLEADLFPRDVLRDLETL